MAYNKKKLVEFINDTIVMNEGLSPTMVKDIERIIKTQIEMGDADEYIQSLSEDNQQIKSLLEDVLDGNVDIEPTINISNVINADGGSSGATFRDALNENIRTNKSFMMANSDILREAMGDIRGSVSSQFNTVLGEEKENVVDPLISIGKGVGKAFNTLRGSGNEQVDALDGIQDTLDDTYRLNNDALELQKSEALRSQREREKKPKDGFFVGLIKKILLIIAAGFLAGGIVGAMMKPFQVMGGAAMSAAKGLGLVSVATAESVATAGWLSTKLRSIDGLRGLFVKLDHLSELNKRFSSWKAILKTATTLDDFFATLSDLPHHLKQMNRGVKAVSGIASEAERAARFVEKWPNLSRILGVIRGGIDGMMSSLRTFFAGDSIIAKILKGIGRLIQKFSVVKTLISGMAGLPGQINIFVKSFAAGFAKLAWPLTILLGIIDGVVGFMRSNEETFLGKVKDALLAVVKGFIEMPLRLLGWIYDKALNFIGIESSGSGSKMVESVMGLLDDILTPIVAVLNFLVDVFWSPIKALMGTIKNAAKFILTLLFGAVKIIWAPIKFIISTVIEFVRMIVGMFKGVFVIVGGVVSTVIATIGGLVKAFFSFLTGDFEGGMGALGGVGDVLRSGLDTIIEGLMSILRAPVEFLESVWGHLKSALGNMVVGFFRMIKAPFTFIKDQVNTLIDSMTGYMEGTVMEPIFTLFEKIGGFIKTVIEWVEKKVSSIPVIGGLIQKGMSWATGGNKSPSRTKSGPIETVVKRQKKQIEKSYLGGFVAQGKHTMNFGSASDSGLSKPRISQNPRTSTPTSDSGSAIPHISQNPPASISTIVQNVDKAKSEAAIRQIESVKTVKQSIDKMNKDSKEKDDRPIVVNTGGEQEKRLIEPPEDIESMSILFLNKSWGLG